MFDTGKKNSSYSSSDKDGPPNVTNPPTELVGDENQMVGIGQGPSISINLTLSGRTSTSELKKVNTKDGAELPLTSGKEKETLHSYKKYKEYKEIMHSVRKDDTDV